MWTKYKPFNFKLRMAFRKMSSKTLWWNYLAIYMVVILHDLMCIPCHKTTNNFVPSFVYMTKVPQHWKVHMQVRKKLLNDNHFNKIIAQGARTLNEACGLVSWFSNLCPIGILCKNFTRFYNVDMCLRKTWVLAFCLVTLFKIFNI